MGGGVITPPYNGWYETYEFKFYDLLIKADNLNTNLSVCLAGMARVSSGQVSPRFRLFPGRIFTGNIGESAQNIWG